MIYLTIYLLGCTIVCFIDIKTPLKSRGYELGDIFSITLLLIVLSWVTVFAFIIAYIGGFIDSNTVLFKHKKK